MVGGTRRQVEKAIEHGFPLMPPGCAIRLDEISQKIVLENLRTAIRNTRRALVDDLRGLPASTTLGEFLEKSSFDLPDVYANPGPGSTFTATRRAAGHLRGAPAPEEAEYAKALGKLLHVNDEERYVAWRSWLTAVVPPAEAAADTREGRLQLMLFAALGQRKRPVAEVGEVFAELWRTPAMREELVELLDVLRERGYAATDAIDPYGIVPIHSHASYGRYEVLAAHGLLSNGAIRESREGPIWSEAHQSDLFFITLNKADEDYTPSTRYQDYPISPTLFHWESQSRTTRRRPPASATPTTSLAAPGSSSSSARTTTTTAA